MKVLILGAGGMIGRKLASRIAADGCVGDRPVSELVLHDIAEPGALDASFEVTRLAGDLGNPEETQRLADIRADIIFHLAAIVSGEAEADFDKGWETNGRATWRFLDAIRSAGSTPRLVFSSSIAVFGAPFPAAIPDDFFTTPMTSYGAQKAISELLITDYSRRGFLDGLSIRLPTICVRPGKPNLAASSFFSGIIREPLNGQEANLPVSDTVRHWFASPRAAVGFLLHAATLDTALLKERRAITMPGLSCTVAEQIEALRQIAGEDAVKLIRYEPDEKIAAIVRNWPENFAPERALQLGFRAETDFAELIRIYLEEDYRRPPP